MVSILADMHTFEAANALHIAGNNNATLNPVIYHDVIFKKYGTDKSSFQRSMEYYEKHLTILAEIYEEVINELSRVQASVSSRP